jgi:ribosome maturation factor RimP
MAANDLNALLKNAKKNWGSSVETAHSSGESNWDDGEYVALYNGVEVKMSQGTKDNPPAWGSLHGWYILEGDRVNETKYEWQGLFYEGDISSKTIKRLEALTGNDASELDPTQLEKLFEDAVKQKQVWRIKLKTNTQTGFQNVYLQEREEGYKLPAELAKGGSAKSTTASKPKAGAAAKPKTETPPAPCAEGDEVTITVGSKEMVGIVDSVDETESEVSVTVGKKTYTVPYEAVAKNEDPDDAGGSDFSEGDDVEFEQGGKTYAGTIDSIDGDEAQVKVGKKLYAVSLSDLKKEGEEAPDDAPFSVGDEITWKVGSKERTGTVTEVDAAEQELSVDCGGKSYTVAFDDATKTGEDAAAESGGITINIGDEVTFEQNGKEYTGICESIDNEGESLEVKVGKKVYTVAFSEVLVDVEVNVGEEVIFANPKKPSEDLRGTVQSLNADTSIATVMVGRVSREVPFDQLRKP